MLQGSGRTSRGLSSSLLLTLAVLSAACSGTSKSPQSGAAPGESTGTFGVFYIVNLSRPVGGTIASTSDGKINCGPVGSTASACGPAMYLWADQASFRAIPDAGQAFQSWAGDCIGTGPCVLDTQMGGADKWIAAVFNPPDQLGHGRITSPSLHGPLFFDFIGGVPGAPQCTRCHGLGYQGLANAPSCNDCHAAAGWTGWQTNCSFCHGTKNATTQAGYSVAATPTWSAPPDAVYQRLSGTPAPSRTGAHQAHLMGKTSGGISFSLPFACSTCHVVPTGLPPPHIDGSQARAEVNLTGLGKPSLGTYSQANGTCTTYCHGPIVGSPASPTWSATGLVCGSCHGLPPTTAQGHPDLGPNPSLTTCAGCHAGTMNGDGTLNVLGGQHVNGIVEATGGHGDYTSPTVHGPRFFDFIAGAPGALQCTGCHGATYGGGLGPSCNDCHGITNGWANWQTNCSFCHGTKSAATKLGYDVTAQPTLSAPPDAITQRLTGVVAPDRTGAHQAHLTGLTGGGLSFAKPFACSTCHVVPTALPPPHIDGAMSRASVALVVPGGKNTGTYDPAAGTCTTYCHGPITGSPASPVWSFSGIQCGACHGLPPTVAQGHPDLGVAPPLTACFSCHPGTMNADGSLNVAGGLHIDGTVQATGHGDFTSPAVHGPQFFDFIGGAPGALQCTNCHGTTYGGGTGPSCNNCHGVTNGWANWQTNCSFCHGTKSAATKAGYSVAANPTWSAPPDAITQRLTGIAAPDRTGAHQAHLAGLGSNGKSYSVPFQCGTCHAVPGNLSHVGTSGTRATVALVGTGQAQLPANLGNYDPATGSCTTYCHGSTMVSSTATPVAQPVWNSIDFWPPSGGFTLDCDKCHGTPPASGGTAQGENVHSFHYNTQGLSCGNCHFLTATSVPPPFPPLLLGDATFHVNGYKDVVFGPAPSVVGVWTPSGLGNCSVNCHGSVGDQTWR